MLVLFPVIQSAALCVFLVPWMTFALYLASSGQVCTSYAVYETVNNCSAST